MASDGVTGELEACVLVHSGAALPLEDPRCVTLPRLGSAALFPSCIPPKDTARSKDSAPH